jgi:WD40 repeat protein
MFRCLDYAWVSLALLLVALGLGCSPPLKLDSAATPPSGTEAAGATSAPCECPTTADDPVQTDLYGNPLPVGAVSRFGTVSFRHASTVTAALFLPDGKTLTSGGDEGSIHFWDRASGRLLRTLYGRGSILCLACSPDGKTLVASELYSREVGIWDTATGKECRRFKLGDSRTDALALSPDGLLATAQKGTLRLWDVTTGQESRHWGGEEWIYALAFSPDCKTLAVGHSKRLITLWDPATGTERSRITWPQTT